MPQLDNKFVCQSYFINRTLQQVIDKKDRQTKKFKKSARKKCRSNLNHMLFSQNFI